MTLEDYNQLPDLLTVKKVAALLNTSSGTVLKMIRTGRIPADDCVRLLENGHWRIRKTALIELLRPVEKEEVPRFKMERCSKLPQVSEVTQRNLDRYKERDIANGLRDAFVPGTYRP
jgi:excisionase family DNA binding protein